MDITIHDLCSRSRRHLVEQMAIMNDVGVLLIQETKFNKNYTDGEISMSGFSVASRCDRFGGLGGGSIIYVRDDIKYHGSKIHNLGRKIQITETRILDYFVFNVYRAPDPTKTEENRLYSRQRIQTCDFIW